MVVSSLLLTDSADANFYNKACENEIIHRCAVCSKCLDECRTSVCGGDLVRIPEKSAAASGGGVGGRAVDLYSGSFSCSAEMGRAASDVWSGGPCHGAPRLSHKGDRESVPVHSSPFRHFYFYGRTDQSAVSAYGNGICGERAPLGRHALRGESFCAAASGSIRFSCGKRAVSSVWEYMQKECRFMQSHPDPGEQEGGDGGTGRYGKQAL